MSKVTRLIGIWGMAGIGKTTFAKEIFSKLRSEYEGYYFLTNEREQSLRHGIDSLHKEVFSGLLANVVKIDEPNSLANGIDRRICHMKVLIVLDDVNDSDHIEKLLGSLDNFGPGSRIIITTTDKQVLTANKADEIYQVGELSSDKALELFNLYAFNQTDHWKYHGLSKKAVAKAKGNPLILKMLAHLLCGKDMQVWESELHKLTKMPPTKVYDVMKRSYDDLDNKEQQIFLDLTCFFIGSHTKVNMGYLKSLLKDGESDNSVVAGLERLKEKALITFSEDNCVSTHDILQKMAWEILRRECREHPGSLSRLWDADDIYEALQNDKGIEAVRSMRIHLSTSKQQNLGSLIFEKMNRLQFLEISVNDSEDCHDQFIRAAEGLELLATELRFLYWNYYPLKSLPNKFSVEKLVILTLPKSRIKYLWHGVKNLVNLKEVDLSYSAELKELPDLSKAINLEVLLLKGCSSLTSVHPSIFSLKKLEKLELQKCKDLKKFSLISKNLKELRLGWTKVKAFPPSLGHLSELRLLCLEGSEKLNTLPSSITDLTHLTHLEVSCCSKLRTIPELPLSLEILDAKHCKSLQTLPKLPSSLKILNVEYCTSLQTLPEFPLSLKTLNAVECKALETLPHLPRDLDELFINSCTSLWTLSELPPLLTTLRARNCTSLRTVLFPSMAVEQLKDSKKEVLFWNCFNMDKDSLAAIELNAEKNVKKCASQHLSEPNHNDVENLNDYDTKYHSYQVLYVYPRESVPDWLEYRTTMDSIIIDLSSAPPSSPLVGFVFCFVIGKYRDTQLERFEAKITISGDKSEGEKDSIRIYIDHWNAKIESDHVCLIYDQRCSAFINNRVKNQTSFKVTIMIQPDSEKVLLLKRHVLKGFGVSPVRTSA